MVRLITASVVVASAFLGGIYLAINQDDANNDKAADIAGFLWPDPPSIGSFTLRDATGNKVTEDAMRGRWTLLFFGFTNCPDICPTTMAMLNTVHETLLKSERSADDVQVMFVSVDPERDDNKQLREYVDYFNPEFLAVTGDDESLNAFTRKLGVLYMKIERAGVPGYTMDHSASVLLIDPEVRFIGVFSQPHDPTDIAARVTNIINFTSG